MHMPVLFSIHPRQYTALTKNKSFSLSSRYPGWHKVMKRGIAAIRHKKAKRTLEREKEEKEAEKKEGQKELWRRRRERINIESVCLSELSVIACLLTQIYSSSYFDAGQYNQTYSICRIFRIDYFIDLYNIEYSICYWENTKE